jgi:hypothetical protein
MLRTWCGVGWVAACVACVVCEEAGCVCVGGGGGGPEVGADAQCAQLRQCTPPAHRQALEQRHWHHGQRAHSQAVQQQGALHARQPLR